MGKAAIRQVNTKYWTEDEDLIVADLSKSAKEISLLLPNRTEKAVHARRSIKELRRLPKRLYWTDEDISFLANNLDQGTYWIAKQLGKTYQAVKTKRSKLKEKKYFCTECGVRIQAAGIYCKDHSILGKRINYYTHKINKGKGGNLTHDIIYDLLKSDCEYCGSEMALGIDRVDSSLGYYTDNSVPCCSTCNVMKMDSNVDDWLNHMVKILENQGVK